jgi:hypothetical protein
MPYGAKYLPSLLHAATRVIKQANIPTVKTESLMLLVVERGSFTAADVSFGFLEYFLGAELGVARITSV